MFILNLLKYQFLQSLKKTVCEIKILSFKNLLNFENINFYF